MAGRKSDLPLKIAVRKMLQRSLKDNSLNGYSREMMCTSYGIWMLQS